MHRWVLRVEAIFDGSWATRPQEVTTAAVGVRLDDCLAQLESVLPTLTPGSRLAKGLGELARVLTHLRPHLLLCYDHPGLPRTNNDLERTIRAIKTRYRRISGRKNWNAYLLRYGSCVAYYEWWSLQPHGRRLLDERLPLLTRGTWRSLRLRSRTQHQPQLDRFRFQHHRLRFLSALEALWTDACCT